MNNLILFSIQVPGKVETNAFASDYNRMFASEDVHSGWWWWCFFSCVRVDVVDFIMVVVWKIGIHITNIHTKKIYRYKYIE